MSNILEQTEEVEGLSPYADYQLGNQKNGFTATLLYIGDSEELESEHGTFICMQGLGFSPNAKTEQEILDSAKLVSIIPNTMLQGKKKNGAFTIGQAYKFVKIWTKGDKYNGRQSKGHGYEVSKYNLPQSILDKMIAKHTELLPEALRESTIPMDSVEV